jgi:hypothetical protein
MLLREEFNFPAQPAVIKPSAYSDKDFGSRLSE